MRMLSRDNRATRVVAVLAVLVAGLLSGCLRYTESLTIHPDDTVSGIVIVAARTPDPVSAPQAPDAPPGTLLPAPSSTSDRIAVDTFMHAHEAGYRVTLTHATFEDLATFAPLGDGGGALLIVRDGDELSLELTADLRYDLDAAGRDYITTNAELTVSLQVPGTVLETNGAASDGAITWDLTPFEVNTLTATIESPLGEIEPAAGATSIDPVWAAVFTAGALIVIAVAWITVRRITRHNPAPAPNAALPTTPVGASEPRGTIEAAGASRTREAPESKTPPVTRVVANPPESVPPSAPARPAPTVRSEHEFDPAGWPPPRPPWKEP